MCISKLILKNLALIIGSDSSILFKCTYKIITTFLESFILGLV